MSVVPGYEDKYPPVVYEAIGQAVRERAYSLCCLCRSPTPHDFMVLCHDCMDLNRKKW